ncbi:YcgL domain-containing protein [Thorsellia kenyensis]|uniref:YcgL domain-containing protein ACFFIT_03405 n=1 Tax=Thorsellia kenyensis TaxID=1549888 RepID=A0ABV6C865_9GAMM
MIVYVYKSSRREDMYLYLMKKDNFDIIPKELKDLFGVATLALFFDLNEKKGLARADIEKVKSALLEEGFYLQLPPKPENLLIHQEVFFD